MYGNGVQAVQIWISVMCVIIPMPTINTGHEYVNFITILCIQNQVLYIVSAVGTHSRKD